MKPFETERAQRRPVVDRVAVDRATVWRVTERREQRKQSRRVGQLLQPPPTSTVLLFLVRNDR